MKDSDDRNLMDSIQDLLHGEDMSDDEFFGEAVHAIANYFKLGLEKLGEMLRWTEDQLKNYFNNFKKTQKVKWVLQCDDYCDACAALAGKVFLVGHVPARHPNCHCALVPVDDDVPETMPYPGNDPMKPPEGFTDWRGQLPEGGERGAWFNPKTKESWHPDFNHVPPKGPHWDYNDGKKNTFSIFENGSIEFDD